MKCVHDNTQPTLLYSLNQRRVLIVHLSADPDPVGELCDLHKPIVARNLFICDNCSLPAVKAAINDLPVSARGHVLLNTDTSFDAQDISKDHPDIQAYHTERDQKTPSSVLAAMHLSALRSIDRVRIGDIECFVVWESRVVREV